MNLDQPTLAAFLGFLGIVVTAIGGVYVATRANKTEKEDSARTAFEETRDEAYEARILLRDERIELLKSSLDEYKIDCRLRIEELETENDRLYIEIKQLKGSM